MREKKHDDHPLEGVARSREHEVAGALPARLVDVLESINENLGTALGFKKESGNTVSREPAIIAVK